MPIGVLLLIVLFFGLPLAWLISEFQLRVWLRIGLGAAAIAMSFGVFYVSSQFERWNYNIWYAEAARKLLEAEIGVLESGENELVLAELRRLRDEIQPTYEVRGNFDELAQHAADRIAAGSRFAWIRMII